MAGNNLYKDPVVALSDALKTIGGAKWSVATTFEFDAAHVDTLIRQEEIDLGHLLVISDNTGAHKSSLTKMSYIMVPTAAASGVHGKVILSRGPNGVVLSVASANLTEPGFGGGNQEIFFISSQPSNDFVINAVRWLKRRISQLRYRINTNWEKNLNSIVSGLRYRHKENDPLWLDNDSVSIADGIKKIVNRKKVRRLKVFSPYVSGIAIDMILRKFSLSRSRIKVVIPSSDFTEDRILNGVKKWRDRLYIAKKDLGQRFSHAKVLVFEYKNGSGLLIVGSANATESGLFRIAGNSINNRSECMAAIPLSKQELKEFSDSYPIQKLPKEDNLSGKKVIVQKTETANEGLIAWYMPEKGLVEICVEYSKGMPGSFPILEVAKKKIVLETDCNNNNDLCYCVPQEKRDIILSALNREAIIRVVWGKLTGTFTLLETTVPDPEGAEVLWGGNKRSEGGSGGGHTGSVKQHEKDTHRDSDFFSNLDEYERRSLQVCNVIAEDLRTPFPAFLEQLKELWETKRDLGCLSQEISEENRKGCYLFLGTRLLAISTANNEKCRLEIFIKIRKDVEALRNELFKKNKRILEQLRRWTDSNMWIEGRAKTQ